MGINHTLSRRPLQEVESVATGPGAAPQAAPASDPGVLN